MKVRQAATNDITEISTFLQELTALGKRISPDDHEFVRSRYIESPDNISCLVAVGDDQTILGLQVLLRASEGNIYGVTPGWGIIGTHVRPSVARRGVGKAVFSATRQAAKRVGLRKIDASIAATNTEGLAYYDAMGFRTYRTPDGKVCKYFEVEV